MTPGKEQFSLEIASTPLGLFMKLSGPLTLQTLFEFQDAGRKETSKPVVVDLTNVPYMDSAGSVASSASSRRASGRSRGFAIFGVAERISTRFSSSAHVDGLLPCFDSLDASDAAAKAATK